MQKEFINSKNRFFPGVIALGKKTSVTLGFMPDGGFEDHANKNAIIIAHNAADPCVFCAAKYRVVDVRVNIMSRFACRIGFCVKVAFCDHVYTSCLQLRYLFRKVSTSAARRARA